MAQADPTVEDQFTETMNKIMEFPKTAAFENANLLMLLHHLIDFSVLVSPRRDTISTLRERIKNHLKHDEMEAFVIGLEKYMDRLNPGLYLENTADVFEASGISVNLMNITLAIRFVVIEYTMWDEVNQVNEQGKEILWATAARFVPVLKTLRVMRGGATENEDRDELRQAVADSADRLELMDRVLAEVDYDPVIETLLQDFFNKHAREDIWEKVFPITNENYFLERNPGGNKCCYCPNQRLDLGNGFAILNICWDLYCLHCVRLIGFASEGHCVRAGCNAKAATYLKSTTFKKFREEVNGNVIGPFQKHFLEPKHE